MRWRIRRGVWHTPFLWHTPVWWVYDSGAVEEDIILDFFSGSCTAAHAVLDLNKQDTGNRKFIMVQLPEPCDENSEAFKAGYKTIADIGKERIRRVIKKIEEELTLKAKENAGKLPGMAEELPKLDPGFKVFKLDKSNFKLWDGSNPDVSEDKLAKQLELHIDHINPNASQEDVLYELLLKAGFKPTEKVTKKKLTGKTVFSIADGALLIFLGNDITRELIDAVAEAEPIQFICLDQAFKGNDPLKANAVQTFEARNQGRDKAQQIVFRTV
jgi:adenine-specific DNA-methyltransferase